jgi:predicted nucleotidyltransferase
MEPLTTHLYLAQRLSAEFSGFPQVIAVGLGGSITAGMGEPTSDIDLYVFTRETIPLADRIALAQRSGAERADMDLQYWDPGDEWFDGESGIEVDLMYWSPDWIQDQVERVLLRHEASMGYTTCFWHTMRQMQVLFDCQGWLAALKQLADRPYPEELRRNIIHKNHPLLHSVIPAYTHQLQKAVRRGDWVSVNHRLAAYLASCFDILFALNRVPHPGEKRLVQHVLNLCPLRPAQMETHLSALLTPREAPGESWLAVLDELNQGMDDLLAESGFLPEGSQL